MASGIRLFVPLVVFAAVSVVAPAASASVAPRNVSPEEAIYTFGTGPAGEAVLSIDSGDLHVEKSVAADGSSVITMSAAGDELRLDVTQEHVAVSSREGNVSFAPNGTDENGETAVRVALARSRAAQRFRSFAAKVSARGRKAAYDQAVALTGALIAQVAGDPGALRSFARRFRPAAGAVRQIAAGRTVDCWGQYEQFIGWAWDQYLSCIARPRTLFISSLSYCEVQYYMRAESAWFQFLSCSAIPIV